MRTTTLPVRLERPASHFLRYVKGLKLLREFHFEENTTTSLDALEVGAIFFKNKGIAGYGA